MCHIGLNNLHNYSNFLKSCLKYINFNVKHQFQEVTYVIFVKIVNYGYNCEFSQYF